MAKCTADAATMTFLTPAGVSALAVVRVEGAEALPLVQRSVSRPLRVGRLVHCELRDDEGVIDDPVALVVDDHTVELSLHGGAWIRERLKQFAEKNGLRVTDGTEPASPFTIDQLDREIERALPFARTELGVRAMLRQSSAWPAMLNDRAAMQRAVEDRALERLLRDTTLAIVGPANAGKSTLANRLFGRERSITADLPGTTRDYVADVADLAGLPVRLIDTPGLRESDDSIEQAAIQLAGTMIDRAELIVLVLDAARPIDEQRPMLERFPQAIGVLNRCDLASGTSQIANALGLIPMCARDGSGVEALIESIHERVGLRGFDPSTPACWSEAQRAWLQDEAHAHMQHSSSPRRRGS